MRKQVIPKLLVVALLLALFCIPFYATKDRTASLSQNSYVIGAVAVNISVIQHTPSMPDLGQINAAVTMAGQTL